MAAPRDLRSRVTDAVTCPICLELFTSPKSLPCLHTFCLKCIAGHCRDGEPGDELACPICRQKFKIPDVGITGLISNFFITDLVEARKTASDIGATPVPCEVCLAESDHDGTGDRVPPCAMYCVDCNQKLCEPCSKPHRRMAGGAHKVVPTGSKEEKETVRTRGGKCDKHKNEFVKLFCYDCKLNICLVCCVEEHQQHKFKHIEAVAVECVQQIDTNIDKVEGRADEARNEISRLDEEKRTFIAGVEEVGKKIVKRRDELKQLIDKQANELMMELQSLKATTCKEIDSHRENVEDQLVAFETFKAYCSELKANGKPNDITRASGDLQSRVSELLQSCGTQTYNRAPAVTLRSVDVTELLGTGKNFIGCIQSDDELSLLAEGTVTFDRHALKVSRPDKPTVAAPSGARVYPDLAGDKCLQHNSGSNTIKVTNLPDDANEALLWLYFVNKIRSGGGEVKAIHLIPVEHAAVISFAHQEDAERVAQRNHSIDRKRVNVALL